MGSKGFFIRIFRISINLKMMFIDFLCKSPKKGNGGALCVGVMSKWVEE